MGSEDHSNKPGDPGVATAGRRIYSGSRRRRPTLAGLAERKLHMSLRRLAIGVVAIALMACAPSALAATPPKATNLEKVSSYVAPGIVYVKTTYEGYVQGT